MGLSSSSSSSFNSNLTSANMLWKRRRRMHWTIAFTSILCYIFNSGLILLFYYYYWCIKYMLFKRVVTKLSNYTTLIEGLIK
jgi:cytochrome b subunit of formate dehydrogenase